MSITASVEAPLARGAGRRMAAGGHHGWLAGPFRAIGLPQLNANAAMLERRDNKYVLQAAPLRQALAALARHFDILEIDGKREFGYDTCYFDDPDRTSYFDHHRNRRRRCKVRIRKYLDAQLCFVEIKLKDRRGITVKKRLDHPVGKHGVLDAGAWAHIRGAYRALYGLEFTQALQPAMSMRYRRITLVAREGGERMTIDRNLVFSGPSGARVIDDGLFLLETKSGNANGIADKILRSLHQHPVRRCSKYCLGMAALREVSKYNNFMAALRQLHALPADEHPRWPSLQRTSPAAGTEGAAARHGNTDDDRRITDA